MKSVTIDRKRPLRDEPKTGHNRWHPDISPIVEVEEGEEVSLETRAATDGYLTPRSTEADLAAIDAGAIHPLTGPVLVKGVRPGDLLEVEFVDIVPQPWAFTAIMPGLGFLRDIMTTPFLVHWDIADGWATSRQLRGVRIPGASFMGVSGVAPSRAQLEAWTRAKPSCSLAEAWSSRPTRPAQCLPRGRRPSTGYERCLLARTAGTST
jgi:formamidase